MQMPRLSLILLTLGAVAAIPGAMVGGSTPAAPAATAPAAPEPATTGASGAANEAVAALRTALDQEVGEGDDGSWSILAVSLDRGDTLYARTPEQALAPASNMKIFTTAAALEYLGADYRFMTYMAADGPIRDGVLLGNLYLYGTGDPTLGTRFAETPAPALRALADSLAALGVREIRGDIVGDGSYFTGSRVGEGWERDYMTSWYAAPAGALSVHENIVRIEVREGEGGTPELTFIPGGRGIAVEHDSAGGGALRVTRTEYEGPIQLRGGTRAGGRSHAVSVADSEMYAAALFRDVLQERGMVLRGAARGVVDPATSPITGRTVFAPAVDDDGEADSGAAFTVLAVHRSEPLTEILQVINHQSQNFYSEQVLRATGRVATGAGSAEGGALAIEALLARAGVDTAAVRVVDGCGLSPLNAASAGAFIGVLAHVAKSPHRDVFLETLPVAGETRRFRRMGGTAAGGNLRAKTGTIEKVSALSGYVTAANGEQIAFSIIGNDLRSVGAAKSLENRIGTQLAEFDRSEGFAAAPATPPGRASATGS